jgi:DNA-directed RNA polymerase sigma subunit (sigma70/sigma32)
MCRTWLDSDPCMNTRCPHNLFWEGLDLNFDKIRITDKALEIRNCCCLIHEPWTKEEIRDIWGLTRKRIEQCETVAWKKVQREYPRKLLKNPVSS